MKSSIPLHNFLPLSKKLQIFVLNYLQFKFTRIEKCVPWYNAGP